MKNVMGKKKGRIGIAVLLLGGLMAGCGTPMYELTDEEEALIVDYSAEVIAKYNIYQKDGVTAINPALLLEEEDEEESQVAKTDDTDSDTGDNSTEKSETVTAVSIEEALSLPAGITFTYKDAYTDNHYDDKGVSSTVADSGKIFVIVEFEMTATSDVDLNILSMNPKFELTVGGNKLSQKTTVMASDLATYLGTVKAGTSQTVVLLFQTTEDKAADLSDINLTVTYGEKTSTIKL